MLVDLATVALARDEDVEAAGQRGSQVAALLGFDEQDQARIAAAVSQMARTAHRDGRGDHVSYLLDRQAHPPALVVRIDRTRGRGPSVLMRTDLPPAAPPITTDRLALVRAVGDLQARQDELVRLNRELEETNRGVVALYAELDDRADHLRAAAELKSRFHSNMTHEFRTPVISIIGLCDLLMQRRAQQGLAPEPEIVYVRESAAHLSALVDDLLDIAKMEAGKTRVRYAPVDIAELFGTLRGMLKPLLTGQGVTLVFEDTVDSPPLVTDAPKVSQILRNLISNALKFTDAGEIRVGARMVDAETIEFFVADTGIGIATSDQERIFEEFLQLEDRAAGRRRGTGLGLPLSRRLADLLGGTLSVRSQPGLGSTFTLRLPTSATAP